ncbi:HAMP domain-containing protein [Chromatium okenii]|uniref:HAMP domain-containing protein n=1 Tax=Chromatium okenii TaxID=61644 RepID=UPI0015595F52|nr:methyl-accepting chemotaxis protein [Chromatium okenii]
MELLIDRSAAVAAHQHTLLYILGTGGLLLLIGLALAGLIARTITAPIRLTVANLQAIAHGDGDLTRRLDVDGRNELAEFARAFNLFVDKIHQLVIQTAGAAAQMGAAAEELAVNSAETNRQIVAEQSETDQVATAINQMTATVEEVARYTATATQSQKANRPRRQRRLAITWHSKPSLRLKCWQQKLRRLESSSRSCRMTAAKSVRCWM